MMSLFRDPLRERLGSWPLAYIPYGGADFGEIDVIADAVGDGDDDAFHAAWTRAADRLVGQADTLQQQGTRSVPASCCCAPHAFMQRLTAPCSACRWTHG